MSLHLHLLGIKPAPLPPLPVGGVRRHRIATKEDSDAPLPVQMIVDEQTMAVYLAAFESNPVLTVRDIVPITGDKESRARKVLDWLAQQSIIVKAWRKRACYFAVKAEDFPDEPFIRVQKTALFCKAGFHRFNGPYRVIETRKHGKLINSRIVCEECAKARESRVKKKDRREVYNSGEDQ